MRVGVLAERIEMVPGQLVAFTIDVANTSEIIDGFTVTLIGLPVESLRVTPEVLSLFPSADGTISVVFSLPPQFPAGHHLLGVQVASATDPTLVFTESLELIVLPAAAGALQLQPERVTGGSQAHFAALVTNLGNVPFDVALAATDAEGVLRFAFNPARVMVPVGVQAAVKVTVEGKRPMIGTPLPRVVTVATQAPAPPLRVVGVFIQKPRFPQILLALLIVLLALGLWALVILFGLNRALVKPGTVAGLVTAESSDTPVAGATVEAYPADDIEEVAGSATTGDDGTFELEVPKGTYRVRFAAADYEATNPWYPGAGNFEVAEDVKVKRGGTVGDVNMRLAGVPASISGVVAAGGDPTGVTVTLRPAAGTAQTLSSPPPAPPQPAPAPVP
ncbi:MAG: carboxypeptidase regulatory-like domain-containing protein, partial [Acidimicrobiia bacterium]